MKCEFSWHIFEQYTNFKFHENLSCGSRVVPRARTDRPTDMTKLIVAFQSFVNMPFSHLCVLQLYVDARLLELPTKRETDIWRTRRRFGPHSYHHSQWGMEEYFGFRVTYSEYFPVWIHQCKSKFFHRYASKIYFKNLWILIWLFRIQEYLDLGLPQLDTPPSSQESTEDEEAFSYLL